MSNSSVMSKDVLIDEANPGQTNVFHVLLRALGFAILTFVVLSLAFSVTFRLIYPLIPQVINGGFSFGFNNSTFNYTGCQCAHITEWAGVQRICLTHPVEACIFKFFNENTKVIADSKHKVCIFDRIRANERGHGVLRTKKQSLKAHLLLKTVNVWQISENTYVAKQIAKPIVSDKISQYLDSFCTLNHEYMIATPQSNYFDANKNVVRYGYVEDYGSMTMDNIWFLRTEAPELSGLIWSVSITKNNNDVAGLAATADGASEHNAPAALNGTIELELMSKKNESTSTQALKSTDVKLDIPADGTSEHNAPSALNGTIGLELMSKKNVSTSTQSLKSTDVKLDVAADGSSEHNAPAASNGTIGLELMSKKNVSTSTQSLKSTDVKLDVAADGSSEHNAPAASNGTIGLELMSKKNESTSTQVRKPRHVKLDVAADGASEHNAPAASNGTIGLELMSKKNESTSTQARKSTDVKLDIPADGTSEHNAPAALNGTIGLELMSKKNVPTTTQVRKPRHVKLDVAADGASEHNAPAALNGTIGLELMSKKNVSTTTQVRKPRHVKLDVAADGASEHNAPAALNGTIGLELMSKKNVSTSTQSLKSTDVKLDADFDVRSEQKFGVDVKVNKTFRNNSESDTEKQVAGVSTLRVEKRVL